MKFDHTPIAVINILAIQRVLKIQIYQISQIIWELVSQFHLIRTDKMLTYMLVIIQSAVSIVFIQICVAGEYRQSLFLVQAKGNICISTRIRMT